ncbi:MAG: pseudaminic acid biosynthesis-associated methylase [Mariniblastus sp.]
MDERSHLKSNVKTKQDIKTEQEFATEQEKFWAGEFGESYQQRNEGEGWIAANTAFFSKIFSCCGPVRSVTELGPNIGLNLMAIRSLLPSVELTGVEISESACEQLRKNAPGVNVVNSSILEWEPKTEADLVFTKGVLIHINPDELPSIYELMYRASKRYLLVAEYYNPTPQMIPYRGHDNRLFKRDFAGEILDQFPDVRLRDYGFAWRRDPNFPQDDLTWFLLEKV